jgi:hypothetical protein
VSDRSAISAANAIDLSTVSLRRAARTTVSHGEQGLERVTFGWRRAVIVEALGGDRRTDPLRDHLGDVDDPLALVDACFDVVAHLHRRGRFRRLAVDSHVATTTRGGGVRARPGDPHGVQPLVDAY